jgi:signal transduction histidine kinase
VSNGGRSIPPEAVDDLFTPFRRLDGRAGSHRHMGLGLSIVRAITTAHAGTATATPHDGGGLTVTVQLPLGESEPGQSGERPGSVRGPN